MVKKTKIEFFSREADFSASLTKFGGQPDWLNEPQWPMSKQLGIPMRFICQIALEEAIFPGNGGKMAYIFMTADKEYVDDTWEADGGENAVIIQPGGIPTVPVTNLVDGPTLQNYVKIPGEKLLQPQNVVLSVFLTEQEDPDFISQDWIFKSDSEDWKQRGEAWGQYTNQLVGNKIGGTPGFLQNDDFPDDKQSWKLLLQLDSCSSLFCLNFGDSGIGYAFINEDASVGKFLWQCS
jgi:uncharacterized protein YwqG